MVLGLEARTGKTPGNLLMGIRSADQDGYAPGAGAVFLRGLITGAGILLAVLAAVLVVVFKWFDAALFILGPLLLVGAAWAVLVVVSNRWDKNGGLRGWNDAAARTLVFDVKAGRDPITTGGIQGPYSFAPLDLPPVQQVLSPVAGATAAQSPAPQPSAPPAPSPSATMPSQTMPYTAPASFAPTAPAQAAGQGMMPCFAHGFASTGSAGHRVPPQHVDDDVERTQVRPGTSGPAPVAVLRIRLDDGRDFQLDRSVLVGRTRWGRPGNSTHSCWPWTIPGAPSPRRTCTCSPTAQVFG